MSADVKAVAREMYAAAMFERDNEDRKKDPAWDFEGSVWDREWPDLQPYCQDMYFRSADEHFQTGVASDPDLQPLLDTWRWAL